MNALIIAAVKLIAKYTLGTGILEQVKAAVDEWATREISGLDKKEGVLNQLKASGLYISQRAFDDAVQLALIWADRETK